MTTSTLIINVKWVCLSFFVSILLISTLAVSSASARRLVVPSETQQTTHNPDQNSFDLHEEPSGRESEWDNNDDEVSTKVPRSADYGNMDGILSVPAIPENSVPKSADHGNMDGILSVPAISENSVPKSADHGNMDGILSVPAISENSVPKSADDGNIDEFPSVSQHNNADNAVPKTADYVNMDEFHRVFKPKNADAVVPNNADNVDIDRIPSISSPRYESDIDGDIDDINSSIYIPRPLTDEPDHEEQFESKDLANAIKPVESSDSVNAMEAAAGVPIH